MQPGTLQLTGRLIDVLLVLLSSGLVTAALNWWFNRQRTEAEVDQIQAEAHKTAVETSGLVIDQLKEVLQDEREQRERLQGRVDTLETDNAKLWDQVRLALSRVGELETEIAEWKKRYQEILARYNRLINWIRRQGLTSPTEAESEQDQ